MRPSLLDILAEPRTGAPLRLEDARASTDGRIEEGRLVSTETGRAYPILRGVPRFVDSSNYADNFGMQWNRFRRAQLDSATGGSHSRTRFDDETGWTGDRLRGRRVLDAGCGAGRFAEVAAARGAELVALDFSSAVDAARETLAPYPNADVVQGNLLEPPFRPGAFDFAYCIGVVQHTPDPPQVMRNVVACVRPGGEFAFTIYGRKRWTKLNGKYLLRPITRRLPQEKLLSAIRGAMPILFPVTDILFRLPGPLGRAAKFAIPVANWVDRAGEYSREQRYQEAILDTFDALAPRYDSPMTAGEAEAALRDAGAAYWNFKERAPVIVTGTR